MLSFCSSTVLHFKNRILEGKVLVMLLLRKLITASSHFARLDFRDGYDCKNESCGEFVSFCKSDSMLHRDAKMKVAGSLSVFAKVIPCYTEM